MGDSTTTLYVQDLDEGPGSTAFLDALNQTDVIEIEFIGPNEDIDQYIKDNSLTSVMVIPSNFSEAFVANSTYTATIDLRLDDTVSTSSVVRNIVSAVVNQFNLGMSGGMEHLQVESGSIVQEHFSYLDFFIPGVVGMTIMTTCVFGMQGDHLTLPCRRHIPQAGHDPMTPFEWLLSRMIWLLFISLLTLAVIMVFGMAVFGMSMTLNPEALLLIVCGSAMFSALGMIIARFVKNEETASAAANAITFPMMFLSGTFFEMSMMPDYLQSFAQVLPLTYLSQGLRDAMVYGNMDGALSNLLVVAVLAVVFVIVAVLVTKWEED